MKIYRAATLVFTILICLFITSCNKVSVDDSVPEELIPNPGSLLGDDFTDPLYGWDSYDEVIAEIKLETDTDKRTALLHTAEDMLMSNYCIIPLYYYNDTYLLKPDVSGVYSDAYGTKYFMYAEKENGNTTLRVNLGGEPYTMDPALISYSDEFSMAVNSFSGLYMHDSLGNTVPACAEGYEVSEDGLTYTVTLKSKLKWSDGSRVTAYDFEYAWKRASSDKTAADYGYMFSCFDGYDEGEINVHATDSTTLVFVLSTPCVYIEELLAFPTFLPVKQSEVESCDDYKTNPDHWCESAGYVSNGAFFCVSWKHENVITFKKNPYYWDADNVKINKIQFVLSEEDSAVYIAYSYDDISFTDLVSNNDYEEFCSTGEFHAVDGLGTYYIMCNCLSSVYEGKSQAQAACMRKAFSILVDRRNITENVTLSGQKAANGIVPYGMADGNGGIFRTSVTDDGYYDTFGINENREETLSEARTLLKSAGFDFGEDGKLSEETPISLTYLTNDYSGHVSIAESVQSDLSVLGIEVTIVSLEWSEFQSALAAGEFDMARGSRTADYNDPAAMLEIWTSSSAYNNIGLGKGN